MPLSVIYGSPCMKVLNLWHQLMMCLRSLLCILQHIREKTRRWHVLLLTLILTLASFACMFADNGDSYVVSDLNELRVIKRNTTPTFVLLVAYGRSGSSWIGDILAQAEESFYVFEPLQRPLAEGYYKENLVGVNDNTYRRPESVLERHDFAITTLYRVFTCQFAKMHPFSQQILLRHALKRCDNCSNPCTTDCSISPSFTEDLKELETFCLSKTHRIIKTIRISMELVSIMMELWPNLKVIHIVRDPRAITNSRMEGRDFNMSYHIVNHSRDMCIRMFDDVAYDWYLQRKHRARLKLVVYEAFAESPFAATGYVYDFLDMLFSVDVWFWVYNSTHDDTASASEYYATSRLNSTKVAYRWRTYLDFEKVGIIDNFCGQVYAALGYVAMDSAEDLYTNGVPSRRRFEFIDGYD